MRHENLPDKSVVFPGLPASSRVFPHKFFFDMSEQQKKI